MSTVEEIEAAIEKLPPEDVARLTRWLVERDAARWNKEMEEDAKAGRLDFLFDEADQERRSGKLKDWPPAQA